MHDIILTISSIEKIRSAIEQKLTSAGVHTVMLVDSAGNVLSSVGTEHSAIDTISLAALTAANFAATSQIAKLIGEDDFTILFHKGKKDSIHFTRVNQDTILLTIFGEDISLGLVRLRSAEVVDDINAILSESN